MLIEEARQLSATEEVKVEGVAMDLPVKERKSGLQRVEKEAVADLILVFRIKKHLANEKDLTSARLSIYRLRPLLLLFSSRRGDGLGKETR